MPSSPSLSSAPSLEIQSLHKQIGALAILTDISLSMAEGEFLVLVGPSGSGKSTLLSCIAGLSDTSSGKILIGGRDMTVVKPADRDIAMVFQSYALFPTMTVAENITFGMKVRKVDGGQQTHLLQSVAAQLKIDHLLARKPGELSGGQRQRVAMARALVRKPTLFLFDEPLSNLDAKLRVSMRTEIKRLHRALGASIVYVTHDQIEAMTLATRIVVLKDGLIQQIGTPAEVYERPASLFVADFMGSPPMNLIPARVTAGEQGLTVRFEGTSGALIAPAVPAPLAGAIDRPVIFGIRPEEISHSPSYRHEDVQVLPLTVDVVEPTGSDLYAILSLGQKECVARLPARSAVAAGQVVPLAFNMSAACYFDPASEQRIAP